MPLSPTTKAKQAEFEDVVEAFRAHHPEGDTDLLKRAYELGRPRLVRPHRRNRDLSNPHVDLHLSAEGVLVV